MGRKISCQRCVSPLPKPSPALTWGGVRGLSRSDNGKSAGWLVESTSSPQVCERGESTRLATFSIVRVGTEHVKTASEVFFSVQPMQSGKGNTHFLLIGDMTDPHAGCDPPCLLTVEHLKFHCLAQANVLLSRRPLCQAWLRGHYKRGNPSSPFFSYKKKKVFRFH